MTKQLDEHLARHRGLNPPRELVVDGVKFFHIMLRPTWTSYSVAYVNGHEVTVKYYGELFGSNAPYRVTIDGKERSGGRNDGISACRMGIRAARKVAGNEGGRPWRRSVS